MKLKPAHISAFLSISLPRKDPFGCMLVAQAQENGCTFYPIAIAGQELKSTRFEYKLKQANGVYESSHLPEFFVLSFLFLLAIWLFCFI